MNPLHALYLSYGYAEAGGLVGRQKDPKDAVLLPVFHENKRSNGQDVLNVLLNESGEFLTLSWVAEDEYVNFPVSESSIGRTGGFQPHPLVDKMQYTSSAFSDNHHQSYLSQLYAWCDWAKTNQPHPILESVELYYRLGGDPYRDALKALFPDGNYENTGSGTIKYEYKDGKGKTRTKSIKFEEVFVTFSIEMQAHQEGTRTVSRDQELHSNFIAYTDSLTEKKDKDICDVSGERVYCTSKHKGLLGNAKIISAGNRYEAYRGRLTQGEDLIRVGFKASQKIHLMLKYLLENPYNRQWLGDGKYLVNWFNNDVSNEKKFFPTQSSDDLFQSLFEQKLIKESAYQPFGLGGQVAQELGRYLTGNAESPANVQYFVMVLEKTSNGRIAFKYFKIFAASDIQKRVADWYESMHWPVYSKRLNKTLSKTPPLWVLIRNIYGEENEKGTIEMPGESGKALHSYQMERLLPSILEGRRLSADIRNRAFRNSVKRSSYKKSWPTFMNTACCVLQKYAIDHGKFDKGVDLSVLDPSIKDRSYLYGRLLAVYNRIEEDANYFRNRSVEGFSDSNEKATGTTTTNAQRLWSSFINMPAKTNMVLSDKTRVYLERLRKVNPGRALQLEKTIQEILESLQEVQSQSAVKNQNYALDEMFLFGYYGQTQSFFSKNDTKKEPTVSQDLEGEEA